MKRNSKEADSATSFPWMASSAGEAGGVSVVREGQGGHYPTGSWPYSGKPGESLPYFWGNPDDQDDLESAEVTCAKMNERMGLSESDVVEIVLSSMFSER